MLRLYILRHVNTGWALPGQRDIDRELNEQGIADLEIVSRWIAEKKLPRTRFTVRLQGEPALPWKV